MFAPFLFCTDCKQCASIPCSLYLNLAFENAFKSYMNKNSRADKSFVNLASLSKEVLVRCPHCNKQAAVVSTLSKYYVPHPCRDESRFRFQCNNCYKPLRDKNWQGSVIIFPVSTVCGNCGSQLQNEKRLVDTYQDKMKIKCHTCQQERLYETNYRLAYANNSQATDPNLGLPLWLQTPVDNHVFWAYNFEHLAYLKQYVGAKLREAPEGGKYSLVWKLPTFVKTAKNRGKILKAIKRLEEI